MDWKPIIALAGVVEQDGKELLAAKLDLTARSIDIEIKLLLPYDPEQSLRSVRESLVEQATLALQQALSHLRSSSPRDVEERDRADLHE